MSKKDTALTELIKELNEAINMKYVKPELYTEPVVKAFTAARDRAIELLPKEREQYKEHAIGVYNEATPMSVRLAEQSIEGVTEQDLFNENYNQYEQGK